MLSKQSALSHSCFVQPLIVKIRGVYVWNGFDLYKKSLDRIDQPSLKSYGLAGRIYKIFFDRFPDGNGQTSSPAANEFLTI